MTLVIQNWLSTYNSPSTVKAYLYSIKAFLRHIYGEGDVEELAGRYLADSRDYTEDVTSFFVSTKDKAPKTQTLMLATVRTFLSEYNIELPQKFWRRFARRRKQGSRPIHKDRLPSNAELRRIISHMPEHGKALFRLMATSGARIGETMLLNMEDVKLNHKKLPSHVTFRADTTKNGVERVGFMTSEAKEDIERWLEVRESYLKAAAKKCKPRPQYKKEFEGKSIEDYRLFPFSDTTAYSMWRLALKKAGLDERDERTNRYSIHPHVLRKWFRTRLGAVIQLDVVEALLGHEGYMTREYRKHSVEDLADFYAEAQGVLMLEIDINVEKLNGKIKEQAEQLKVVTIEQAATIAKQSQLIEKMDRENMGMGQRIEQLEIALKALSDHLQGNQSQGED